MKKILLTILVVAIILSAAACGKNKEVSTDDKTSDTTSTSKDTDTNESTTDDNDVTTTDGTTTDSGNSNGSTTTEHDESEVIEELDFESEENVTPIFTSRRTGNIEISLRLDGETYGPTLGIDYGFYTWVVEVKDSNGTVTKLEVEDNYNFTADQSTGKIKIFFAAEELDFIPTVGENYEVTVTAFDDENVAKFRGTTEITATVGYLEDETVKKDPRELGWTVNDTPYENHHTGAPHQGRVVIVYKTPALPGDGDLFTAANILTNFDIYMYVDGQKHTIQEVSSWSQGLRFGVEGAGFAPTVFGQHNEIRFELCEKGTDKVLFEIPKSVIYFGMSDSNRQEDLSKQYDQTKVSATGPAGYSNEELSKAFDGQLTTKYCVSKANITSAPVVITTEDAITLASISFVTANDSKTRIRVPSGFKIEASTDGTTWTTILDVPTAEFENIENFKEYNFAIDAANRGAYSKYRITFTANDTVQFSEIMLFLA